MQPGAVETAGQDSACVSPWLCLVLPGLWDSARPGHVFCGIALKASLDGDRAGRERLSDPQGQESRALLTRDPVFSLPFERLSALHE